MTVSGNVNTKKAGAYTVTYTFTDQNTGQKVTTSATVNVIDNTAISSKTSDSILVGNNFSPKTNYISYYTTHLPHEIHSVPFSELVCALRC